MVSHPSLRAVLGFKTFSQFRLVPLRSQRLPARLDTIPSRPACRRGPKHLIVRLRLLRASLRHDVLDAADEFAQAHLAALPKGAGGDQEVRHNMPLYIGANKRRRSACRCVYGFWPDGRGRSLHDIAETRRRPNGRTVERDLFFLSAAAELTSRTLDSRQPLLSAADPQHQS